MEINVLKFKGIIVEKGTTQEAVAEKIGINRSTFYRRLKNGGRDFTLKEMHSIISFLQLTDHEVNDIFLSNVSH